MQGRNGAISVIALAERGALFDPGPCMYMEKLAGASHVFMVPHVLKVDMQHWACLRNQHSCPKHCWHPLVQVPFSGAFFTAR